MKNTEKQIFDYLYKNLSPKRFEHSYNVSLTAIELSKIFKESTFEAQVAGLLHDCAKAKTDKELIAFYRNRKKGIKYFFEIKNNSPKLLHSFASAVIAKEKLGIKNKNILNAIKNHTLGRNNMSVLEKIIFVADVISKDRKYKGISKIRKIAKQNIDEAFMAAMKLKIIHTIEKREWICPQSIDTWNFYAKKD